MLWIRLHCAYIMIYCGVLGPMIAHPVTVSQGILAAGFRMMAQCVSDVPRLIIDQRAAVTPAIYTTSLKIKELNI